MVHPLHMATLCNDSMPRMGTVRFYVPQLRCAPRAENFADMQIAYVDGPRLRRALLAGCAHAQGVRAELNRINVYPVPDGDTGTNLALTVRSLADGLRADGSSRVDVIASQAAESAILGARGNCGMILSHFLLGFAEAVRERSRLSAPEFAAALDAAVVHLYGALERPVEGTMLTVMREVAEEAKASQGDDFLPLFERMLERAQDALARTPDLLPALKKAGVVDAGAKGFVALLEGVQRYVVTGDVDATDIARPAPSDAGEVLAAAQVGMEEAADDYRFCTEALVRGAALPPAETVRAALRDRGGSLIVLTSGDVLKVHIHTDEPEPVFEYLRGLGELMAHKAEDMAVQHAAVERTAGGHVTLARRPVGVVTDSACDLPDEVVRAHGIEVVPLMLVFGDETLRDRVDISADEFAARLVAGAHGTTSQPAPAAFLEAYRRAAENAESIVAVLLASTLSGTLSSGETAAKKLAGTPVTIVDSLGASLLQGLLTVKAAELAEAGATPEAIRGEINRIRAQSGIFFTVDTFDRLLKSGRVSHLQAFLGNLFGIRPILGIEPDGKVAAIAKARGRAAVVPRTVALLRERIPTAARKVRFGIIHVARPEVVGEVKQALTAAFGRHDTLVAPATPVIANHLGPGAWGVAYMVED